MKFQLKLFLFLFLFSMLIKAEDFSSSFGKTPQEEAMCQSMIYNNRDTSDRNSWQHMHHFCDCMRFTNRALSAFGDRYTMHYDLGIAIGGCDYVLKNTAPNFYMRPEIHLQKGLALRLDKQEGKAVLEFMEAIRGNPRLAKAYVELANTQVRIRIPKDALKTVSDGLRHNPNSKALQRIYTELGGKQPFPEPIQSEPVESKAPKDSIVNETQSIQVSEPSKPEAQPKIGSPKNPYCRFCTDAEESQPVKDN